MSDTMTAPDIFALGGQEDDPIPALVDEWFRAWADVEKGGDCDRAAAITGPINAALFDAVPSSLAGITAQLRFLRRFAIDGTLYSDNRMNRLIDALIAGVERMTGGSAPASYPIETAPRVPDARLLLWPQHGDTWMVGHWDGEGWFEEFGFRVNPLAWAPLPPPPVPA